MIYQENINRIRKELRERKEDLTRELEKLPDGELYCSGNSGYRKYYQRFRAVGNRKKERRYGIKSDAILIGKLVRKEYIIKAIEALNHDMELIESLAEDYIPTDENSIMTHFVEKYPELAEGIYRQYVDVEEWKSRFERIEGYHPENLKQTAVDGTKMRSKNEVYIASRLDHYGINYRSDCPTGIPGLNRAPDFTILRSKDRKIIYWEHLGMMDDSGYRLENRKKLKEYESFGIVPWDNLVLTYDTPEGGLRADLIEAMIQGWLL